MKFTIFAFIAAFALIEANPIQVSDNNVGDIVTVEENLAADVSSKIETNILTAILAALNQQAELFNGKVSELNALSLIKEDNPILAKLKNLEVTPEMKEKFKSLKISPELVEKVHNFLNKEE